MNQFENRLKIYSLTSYSLTFRFREIRIGSIWNSLNEDVVVDSEVYTDLDATQAPLWVAQVELNDNVPSLLYKSLTSFLDSCRSTQTTEFLLGKNYTVLQSPGMRRLILLTSLNVPPILELYYLMWFFSLRVKDNLMYTVL